MRGKGVPIVIKRLTNGITPAYAGKSPHARGQTCHGQDHPRLCGEKQFRAVPPDGYIGSPPPMRGKDVTALVKIQFQRITPAYAGKRKRKPNGMLQSKDHPRLCGEKVTAGSSWFRLAGSPPPMRGKEGGKLCAIIMPRITPAYAGKSYRSESTLHSRPDHPRLCGEKTMSSVFSTADTGSPPPMRGKAEITRTKFDTVGITPAYAGKRFQFPDHRFPCQDHPRLCGEKRQRTGQKHFGEGSPPPMRGKASQWQCL